jgi:hypothetical protein
MLMNTKAELQAFAYVAKLRHVYHTAAGDEKYDDYYNATTQMRNAHDRSQYGCYMATARLSLAILKAEGNTEARALDLAKVGLDLAETEEALEALAPAAAQAATDAINAETDKQTKSSRHGIFSNGVDRLKKTVAALKAGEPTYEYNAFAIIDWGVTPRYVEATAQQHGIDSEVRNQVVARNLAEGDIDVATIQAKGAENLTYLTGLFDPIQTGPRTPAEPEPAPSTSQEATTSQQPTSEPKPSEPAPGGDSSQSQSSTAPSWLKVILGIVAALGIGGIIAAVLGHLKLLM